MSRRTIITEQALPSRENPRRIGKHQAYYHAGVVLVIVYSGAVEAHEMRTLITMAINSEKRLLATVGDIGDLGDVGKQARKVLLDGSVTDLLRSETVPLGLFVVNANAVRRAIMKFALLAARIVSKRAQRVYFAKSREEAEERAAAYHAENIGKT